MSHHARRLTGLILAAAAVVLASPAVARAEFEPTVQSRIVGGTPASPGEYPYQALLEINFANGTGGRCGGALIAARFILTAAHCMSSSGSPADAIAVSLGATDVTTPPRNFHAVDLVVHPRYNGDPGGGFDAAVILLDKAADFEQLRLLRPADGAKWSGGVMATAIGWGATDDGKAASNQLLEVQVPMFSDASCASDFGAVGASSLFLSETMVCAGGKDKQKDSCQGDSGGPLLVPDGARFALGGVVSFGIGPEGDQCASGYPGVYSRVGADPLNGWVRSLVPQVEIDANPAQPEPGQQVALTAAGNVPYGLYEWDLDNDGAFDDGTGPTASVTTPRGVTTVAVRATRAAADPTQSDREVRRTDLDARFRSPVSFPAANLTVTEGQPVTVTVDKSGGGTGTITATPATGTAAIGGVDVAASAPFPLTFGEAAGPQTFTIPTVDDKTVEQAETFTIDLGNYTGELVAGAHGQLTVTINDNDVRPKIKGLTKAAKRKGGKIALKYRLSAPATVTLGITDSRGRAVLAATRKKHAKAGTYTTKFKLTKAGKRLLRKKRVVTGRVVYAIFDGDDILDSQVLRFKLKR